MSGSMLMAWLVRARGGGEHAERINAAAELAEAGVPAAEAAGVLAARFGCSVRQARRYVEQAAALGPGAGAGGGRGVHGQAAGPAGGAVREHARASGRTISAVVAQALEEFFARGRRNHPRR